MSDSSDRPPQQNPVEYLLQFFQYDHLPPDLQSIAKTCAIQALGMAKALPVTPETTVGLRKLLEAKDCFVRAAIIGRSQRLSDDAAERSSES